MSTPPLAYNLSLSLSLPLYPSTSNTVHADPKQDDYFSPSLLDSPTHEFLIPSSYSPWLRLKMREIISYSSSRPLKYDLSLIPPYNCAHFLCNEWRLLRVPDWLWLETRVHIRTILYLLQKYMCTYNEGLWTQVNFSLPSFYCTSVLYIVPRTSANTVEIYESPEAIGKRSFLCNCLHFDFNENIYLSYCNVCLHS